MTIHGNPFGNTWPIPWPTLPNELRIDREVPSDRKITNFKMFTENLLADNYTDA